MMERYGGLPQSTISDWITKESVFEGERFREIQLLRLPSGKTLRVTGIIGLDNNEYLVLEVAEWVLLAADVLKQPGRVKKATQNSLIDFLSWFAVKGFYADAYAFLKGNYTEADSRAVSSWMQSRLAGIATRNRYTKFLNEHGCEEWYEYANWTNYIYIGLFSRTAKQMKEEWELVEGSKNIGRNYIPEVKGLEAVDFCERQVIELHHQDLKQAHDDAIDYAKKRGLI
jgi:hypothetical protein